jgi:hypothetical protein
MQGMKGIIDILSLGEILQKLFVLLPELMGLIEVLAQFLGN